MPRGGDALRAPPRMVAPDDPRRSCATGAVGFHPGPRQLQDRHHERQRGDGLGDGPDDGCSDGRRHRRLEHHGGEEHCITLRKCPVQRRLQHLRACVCEPSECGAVSAGNKRLGDINT